MNGFLRVFWISILSLGLLVGGCSLKSGPRESDWIRIQISSDPVSLDPTFAEDGLSLRILGNVMDGLMRSDADGNIVPALASEVDLTRDGKTYRFKIRPDQKWSDGVPLRLEDFVVALKRARDPASGAKLAAFLEPLVDGDEAVKIEGETLVLKLKRRTAHFLGVLTLPLTFPLRSDILQANGGKWPEVAPSIGKYTLVERKADQWIRMLPRDSAQLPVEWTIVRDETTAVALFEAGKIQILSRVPATDAGRLEKLGLLRRDPFYANTYVGFNVRHPELKSPERRRALSQAIDRQDLVKVLGGEDLPDSNWLPAALLRTGRSESLTPSLGGSRATFRFDRSPELEFRLDANTKNQAMAERVQAEWKAKLGLRVRLNVMDWKSHVGSLRSDPPAIFRMGWMTPFKDPLPHLKAMTSKSPFNYTGWSNATYDRWVSEIETLPKGEKRDALILAAEKLLVETEAVIAPLYQAVLTYAVRPELQGFRSNPFGMVQLDLIKKAKN